MGKATLIAVLLALLSLGGLLYGMRHTLFHTEEKLLRHEERVLAREAARSAFNLALSQLKRDLSWRAGWTNRPYKEARMDVTIQEVGSGQLELVATGRYGSATVQIRSRLATASGFPAALTLDVPALAASFSGSAYSISGYDQRPPSMGGGSGPGPHAHGAWSTNTDVANILLAALNKFPPNTVTGTGGQRDVRNGSLAWDLTSLAQELETRATQRYTGNQAFSGNQVFGSPTQPAIVLIDGDAAFSGTVRGYGALLVKGSLVCSGNFSWEGLVFVQNSGHKQVSFSGNPSIYGAFVIRNTDPGLPGGHFDVDVFDRPNSTKEVYHEHEYDDKYNVTYVDLLNDSRLRWDLVHQSGASTIRIELINTQHHGGGVLTFDGGSGPQRITLPSSFTVTVPRNQVRALRIDFRSLGALRGTEPKQVQEDPVGRDGALTVRVYNASTNRLVYELAIYHHLKKNSSAGGGSSPLPTELASGKVLLSMSGSVQIQYSSAALQRLSSYLPRLGNLNQLLPLEELER